jgi:hypothetical protein
VLNGRDVTSHGRFRTLAVAAQDSGHDPVVLLIGPSQPSERRKPRGLEGADLIGGVQALALTRDDE